MAILPCPACGKPMSSTAAVCPHCNARRADVPTGIAGKTLSSDEVRALLVASMKLQPAPAPGLVPALVLPHPSTTGVARGAELALTVVALPLVAIGALTLAITRRKRREPARGELAPVMAMLGVGGFGYSTALSLLGASVTTNLALTATSMLALILRGVIRARAGARDEL
jgi:hypothetical protein